jgi:predicted MFS family arabinose efflux permease
MPFFKSISTKINQIPLDKKLFLNIILIILFWAIFDGTFSYIVPIFLTGLGLSKTQMGLIISFSSVFGATFDFLLSKFFKNTHYRRLFLFFYILCFIFPFILWSSSKVILLSIIAMAVWGLYYDLMNFALFDFIGNHSKSKNSQRFGIAGIFKSVGISIAPILASFLIADIVTFTPFLVAFIFILLSFIFYLVLVKLSQKNCQTNEIHQHHSNFFREISLWKKIGFIIFPVLFFNTLLYIFDAAFWVIGPLFSQTFPNFKDFGGLFMLMYTAPTLIICWFVGKLTQKYGKKKTAFISFLIGNIILLPFFLLKNPIIILITVFCSSFIASLAWPAISGAYGDYINESEKYDREIEGLSDFSINLGYIIGPILVGLIADSVNISFTFSLLAFINIIFVILLLIFTPKKININI